MIIKKKLEAATRNDEKVLWFSRLLENKDSCFAFNELVLNDAKIADLEQMQALMKLRRKLLFDI